MKSGEGGKDEGEGKVEAAGFYLLLIHLRDGLLQQRCLEAEAERWSRKEQKGVRCWLHGPGEHSHHA